MKLDLDKIKSVCTPASFERGTRYYREGRVSSIERFGDRITAIVKGTEEYKVTVRQYAEDFSASCNCFYRQGGCCKHIVAVLLLLLEEKGRGDQKIDNSDGLVKTGAAHIHKGNAEKLLEQAFARNRDFGNLLDIYNLFQDSAKKRLQRYKSNLRRLYRKSFRGSGYHRYGIEVDFTDLHDLAEFYVLKGNFAEALLVNQALTEVIAEKMDWVDDSDGYYGRAFADAMHDFANTIDEAGYDHQRKRTYIKYLFKKFIENDPDYFEEYYYAALQKACTNSEDLTFWKGLLEPHLPEGMPDMDDFIARFLAWRLFSMQFHILEGLDERDEFYALMERCYRKDREFCLMYAERLVRNGNAEKAVRIAEEDLVLFPEHLREGLRRFLGEFYKKSAPQKYKRNLKALFLEEKNWKDYDELKALCTPAEWSQAVEGIIAELLRVRYDPNDSLLEVFLKEGMYEMAMNKVLAGKSLHYLEKYHQRLALRFPEEYFKAYKELIIPFAKANMGRAHYREVTRYLELMKGIEGFEEEVVKLVETFKTTYAKRPAFLDELREIK